MRPSLFSGLISFEEALRIVIERARPIDRTETVDLTEADGRVAAEDVTSRIDVPPFDRAAMDGYAVVAEDTANATGSVPRKLNLVSARFAGDRSDAALNRGEAMEVGTGAPLPRGATAVVMVEHTVKPDAETVLVSTAVSDGQHIGRRAADIRAGQKVIARGDVMTPSQIGALAATGVASVVVFALPSVAILSTGNEVAAPGQPLAPGQIYDTNRFTVAAVVRRHGGHATFLPVAADTLEDLDRALTSVARHDIAVFSGGSSVGSRDLMGDAVAARGDVIFHGIAVKPGKPTLFGQLDRTMVFGLPGYPTSCLVNAYILLVPHLRKAARLPPWRPETRTLPLARRLLSVGDRYQFCTVRIVDGQVMPAFKASGDITSMAEADGYIEIPSGTASIEAGEAVVVTLFN